MPFEVWKRPDELGQAIATAVATLPRSDQVAVTMTAELCDCYPTKQVGVNAVLDAVIAALPDGLVSVWGVDGEFHSVADARSRPQVVAAANWLALATLAARLLPRERCLLIDIGTTTTDLIPLDQGTVAAMGRSDTERLQTGRAGVRRGAPHAGLRAGDRAAASRSPHRVGRRALCLDAGHLPHDG